MIPILPTKTINVKSRALNTVRFHTEESAEPVLKNIFRLIWKATAITIAIFIKQIGGVRKFFMTIPDEQDEACARDILTKIIKKRLEEDG
jgi:hypothetical protein